MGDGNVPCLGGGSVGIFISRNHPVVHLRQYPVYNLRSVTVIYHTLGFILVSAPVSCVFPQSN